MLAHAMTHAEPAASAVNANSSGPLSSVTIIGTTPKQIIATYRHMPLKEKRCGQIPTKPLPTRPPKPIATSIIPTKDDCIPRCFETTMGAPIVNPTNARFKIAASKNTTLRHVEQVVLSPVIPNEAYRLSVPPNSRAAIANVNAAVSHRASIPKHP